jgi:hypothetical protein
MNMQIMSMSVWYFVRKANLPRPLNEFEMSAIKASAGFGFGSI